MADERRIDYLPIDSIQPAPNNPKDHDEAGIAASISRFGYVEPLVLDERTGRLVGGHGRLTELQRRQHAGEAPPDGIRLDAQGRWLAPVSRGWASRSDDEATALLVAINRLTERGGWHNDELYALLDQLSTAGPDGLDGIGFDTQDLDDLLATLQEGELAFDEREHFGGDGAHADRAFDERAQRYARNGVRSLVLDYNLADFDIMAATCARLRRHYGHETNADLVRQLVLDASHALPVES